VRHGDDAVGSPPLQCDAGPVAQVPEADSRHQAAEVPSVFPDLGRRRKGVLDLHVAAGPGQHGEIEPQPADVETAFYDDDRVEPVAMEQLAPEPPRQTETPGGQLDRCDGETSVQLPGRGVHPVADFQDCHAVPPRGQQRRGSDGVLLGTAEPLAPGQETDPVRALRHSTGSPEACGARCPAKVSGS
jgi:hypothetical protein